MKVGADPRIRPAITEETNSLPLHIYPITSGMPVKVLEYKPQKGLESQIKYIGESMKILPGVMEYAQILGYLGLVAGFILSQWLWVIGIRKMTFRTFSLFAIGLSIVFGLADILPAIKYRSLILPVLGEYFLSLEGPDIAFFFCLMLAIYLGFQMINKIMDKE
jgi:hypothetical protein